MNKTDTTISFVDNDTKLPCYFILTARLLLLKLFQKDDIKYTRWNCVPRVFKLDKPALKMLLDLKIINVNVSNCIYIYI